MSKEQIIDEVEQYLAGMKTELWPGEAFYLTDPISREAAARWLYDAMEGVALINQA